MDMHKVTIHEAKTHLSRLIKEALEGEEVIIAKGKNPLVKLSPLSKPARSRKIGEDPGIVEYIAKDFDETPDDFKDYLT